MQSKEQRLIEGLFQRLKQAEQTTGPRDAEAEKQIQGFIQNQPSAPYYMAQSILIQEAALNRLHQQVQQLQQDVTQLKNASQQGQSRGGFLSGIFGSCRAPQKEDHVQQQSSSGYTIQTQTPIPTQMPAPARRGGDFLSGALQTAAGVAGGVVLGNMLTNLFHHEQPEEIVTIIEDPILKHEVNSEHFNTLNDFGDDDCSNDDSE